ncbi:EamA family transporter [uncultured Microscilla sp.]|uniref:DMT family transporter n=1 Tax=uncultured Microscilla sp. TaxID=432653 RepID=UPI00262DB01C|nr:EamA family transporter [uncultured Microscilla sp.]
MKQTKHLIELNIALVFLSTSGVLGKLVTTTPAYTIFWRCVIAALALAGYVHFQKLWQKPKAKETRFWLISGAFFGLHMIFYFYAIGVSTVAIAFISLFTYPIITTLIEPLFFKQKFDWFNLISAVLIAVGIVIMTPEFSLKNNTTLGVLLGVIAAAMLALRNLMSKHYMQERNVSGSVVMLYQLIVSVVVLLPALVGNYGQNSWQNMGYIALLGVATTAVGHTVFISKIRYFKASTQSIIAGVQPIYGIVWAVLLIGEKLPLRTIIGGSIIIFTVCLESLKQVRKGRS